jgi:hypothetical protein
MTGTCLTDTGDVLYPPRQQVERNPSADDQIDTMAKAQLDFGSVPCWRSITLTYAGVYTSVTAYGTARTNT